MHKIAPLLAACLLAIAANGASAQTIYQWRDAHGETHISDTPPPADIPAKDVVSRHSSAVGVPSMPPPTASGALGDLQKKKAAADQQKAQAAAATKAADDKKAAAERAQFCDSAKENVNTLQSGMRIAQVNANGEREYLDDAAIAARVKQSQQQIAQNCGNAAPASN